MIYDADSIISISNFVVDTTLSGKPYLDLPTDVIKSEFTPIYITLLPRITTLSGNCIQAQSKNITECDLVSKTTTIKLYSQVQDKSPSTPISLDIEPRVTILYSDVISTANGGTISIGAQYWS